MLLSFLGVFLLWLRTKNEPDKNKGANAFGERSACTLLLITFHPTSFESVTRSTVDRLVSDYFPDFWNPVSALCVNDAGEGGAQAVKPS